MVYFGEHLVINYFHLETFWLFAMSLKLKKKFLKVIALTIIAGKILNDLFQCV